MLDGISKHDHGLCRIPAFYTKTHGFNSLAMLPSDMSEARRSVPPAEYLDSNRKRQNVDEAAGFYLPKSNALQLYLLMIGNNSDCSFQPWADLFCVKSSEY
jgi:hypothetical protein